MSLFDELRASYSASRNSQKEYRMKSIQFIHSLAPDFKKYIEAPDLYRDEDSQQAMQYVTVLAADKDEETGEFVLTNPRITVRSALL